VVAGRVPELTEGWGTGLGKGDAWVGDGSTLVCGVSGLLGGAAWVGETLGESGDGAVTLGCAGAALLGEADEDAGAAIDDPPEVAPEEPLVWAKAGPAMSTRAAAKSTCIGASGVSVGPTEYRMACSHLLGPWNEWQPQQLLRCGSSVSRDCHGGE
jgi:hypothetical protein